MRQDDQKNEEILLSTGKVLTVSTPTNDSSKQDESEKAVVNRVKNVWGSSSGAGSDFLDKYRKERALEMSRLEEVDKKWKEDMENKLFHSQRMYRIKKENDKTLKRKMRREKRKIKIASLKQSNKSNGSVGNNSSKSNGSDINNMVDDENGEHVNNFNNYVSNVSYENYSENILNESKDSCEKKSKLMIVDKSEIDI